MKADKEKLRIAMANACMNTKDLQKATGMPRPTVNNVISGKAVRTKTIGSVAKALGVSVETILFLDGK